MKNGGRSAAEQLVAYLEAGSVRIGEPVLSNEIQVFENRFGVCVPNDFREYLLLGAGSSGMMGSDLVTFHPWGCEDYSLEIHRYSNYPHWSIQFADHSLFVTGFELCLIPDELGNTPVFTSDWIRVADSFTQFINRFLNPLDSVLQKLSERENDRLPGIQYSMLIDGSVLIPLPTPLCMHLWLPVNKARSLSLRLQNGKILRDVPLHVAWGNNPRWAHDKNVILPIDDILGFNPSEIVSLKFPDSGWLS